MAAGTASRKSRNWERRVLWFAAIWAASVLALGAAAACLRLTMTLAGLVA